MIFASLTTCLAQVHGRVGREAPDCDDPGRVRGFFDAIVRLRGEGLLLAYHDRSDGIGLFVTLAEMAFTGHCGVDVELGSSGRARTVAALFAEELGAVLQVRAADEERVQAVLREAGLGAFVRAIGRVVPEDRVVIHDASGEVFAASRTELRRAWSETSHLMQSLRDNPECAREEYERASDPADPGMFARLTYDPSEDVAAPYVQTGVRPRVATLREHLALSWVGFWAGQLLGTAMGWTFAEIGSLNLGMATLGSAIFLGVGYWLSLVEVDRKKNR